VRQNKRAPSHARKPTHLHALRWAAEPSWPSIPTRNLPSPRNEASFFSSHAAYRDVAPQCGVSNLAGRLNSILVEHIRSLLPGLRRRVQEMLEQRLQELKALGDPTSLQSKSARGAFLLQLLCDYSERLGAMLDGRHVELTSKALSGGARLRHVFIEVFGRTLKTLNPVKGISDEEISTVIKNGAGVTGERKGGCGGGGRLAHEGKGHRRASPTLPKGPRLRLLFPEPTLPLSPGRQPAGAPGAL
jgi:hypothetical protein